jgi:spermidine/putrescine transport system substrate-binding protein
MCIYYKHTTQIFLAVFIGLWLVSCSASPILPPVSEATATSEQGEKVLNIYNWDTYIDPEILTGFEREYSVKVNYTIYGSNEEMYEVIKESLNGGLAHDIIVPTDYMVAIMRKEGLLAPLDIENISNLENIESDFLNASYDPGNRYCVPYLWGTQGLGYNIKATGVEIHSWRQFLDPIYAGQISLLNDSRATMGMTLLYLGFSPNTTDKEELTAARDFLLDISDQVAAYADDTGQDLLNSGEVALAFEYSGDILQIMSENPNIRYAIPDEGAIIWMDNMCIPVNAQHKTIAEAFINYILSPEIGAALANYTHYSSPNTAAMPMVNAEDRNNAALYPSSSTRRRLFFLSDVGPEATDLYDQYWEEVMESYNQ